jgi:hypothetical protein
MFTDNFTNLSHWGLYNSPGHDGNGIRSGAQVTVTGGVANIAGTVNGTTGGMQLNGHDQQYGQWSIRMKAPKATGMYHPVVLLWGVGSGGGVNAPTGEIDIAEGWETPNRDKNDFTLHYGDGSLMIGATTAVNMAAWHIYNVVWTSEYMYTWIDDLPAYWQSTDTAKFPKNAVQLCIQLDWFPDETQFPRGAASMQIDWIKQYALSEIP